MMDRKKLFLDAYLYTMEGERPEKAIENQEKREQMTITANARLPKRTNDSCVPKKYRFKGLNDDMGWSEREHVIKENNLEYTKTKYEKMGIMVVGDYDDLFYSVSLPEGWEVRRTDHSMWNELVDSNGRKRISFFYKGSFYDRDAFNNFACRYSFRMVPFDNYETDATYQERELKPWKLYITDGGKDMKLLTEITPKTYEEYRNMNHEFTKMENDFLDENYPEWQDVDAY